MHFSMYILYISMYILYHLLIYSIYTVLGALNEQIRFAG